MADNFAAAAEGSAVNTAAASPADPAGDPTLLLTAVSDKIDQGNSPVGGEQPPPGVADSTTTSQVNPDGAVAASNEENKEEVELVVTADASTVGTVSHFPAGIVDG